MERNNKICNQSRKRLSDDSTNKELSLNDNLWTESRPNLIKRSRNDECNSDKSSFKKNDCSLDKERREKQHVAPSATFPSYSKGNYCQYDEVPAQENIFFSPVKEIVHLTNSVLYPPNPNAPPPTTRKRPLGCKTVFVCGLPEKITEEILKEIFDRCGIVETIRMSKKNFCHIRFADELFVENALFLSGYRLKVENKDEASFTGCLNVDYAQVRDDQYDYECKQRALLCQARHEDQAYYRPPTPPVVHYTDHEASLICEKLKSEETFTQAASILITWLEKGECCEKTASSFFSMIQSTHNYVRKLQLDKVKYEEQLNEAKKMLKKQLEGIICQFTVTEKIFKAASLQKCWDQFTEDQRKNIEMWKKQMEELKNAHLEEVINERKDEEMKLSDDENSENKKITDIDQIKKQYVDDVNKLEEEIDTLGCQLNAAKNELMFLQYEYKEERKRKENHMATLQQALQKSKEEELFLIQKVNETEVELKKLREYERRIMEDNPDSFNEKTLGASSNANVEEAARFIRLVSTFLHEEDHFKIAPAAALFAPPHDHVDDPTQLLLFAWIVYLYYWWFDALPQKPS